MSRPRFLTDQDFNANIVTGVRRTEALVELVSVRELGLATHPDAAILDYAASNGFIVISHDARTMRAHAQDRIAQGLTMTGLCLVRQRRLIRPVVESILLIWTATEAEEWLNRIEFLPI